MSYHDHFSGHAKVYAASRPDYPPDMFAFLAAQAGNRHTAWDCAAGNGQATVGLLPYFESVLMTDASERQLSQTRGLPVGNNALQGVMLAERLALRPESVDLAVVAQALHWFDLERFFPELDRVLRKEGLFATWCYGKHRINAACDEIVQTLYEDVLGAYWAPQRKLVETAFRGIGFPYQPVPAPEFKLQKQWSIEQVLGYLNSWSAVQRYIETHEKNPIYLIEDELRAAFGTATTRTITWPLTLIVRRKRTFD